jgi:hypothetical protein
MKVKSLVMGLINGYQDAFNELDKLVSNLKATEIEDVTDTLYPAIGGTNGAVSPRMDAHIVRVVTYR